MISPTEILERQEEASKLLQPSFGRIFQETIEQGMIFIEYTDYQPKNTLSAIEKEAARIG